MLSQLAYKLILNIKNIPGPTINGKIVVIESDDYGGIRMPSLKSFERLKAAGISTFNSRFDRFDTLESDEDLIPLFDTLQKVKDKNGNPAVISPFVNVANPDFEKIKDHGYQEYFNEPFTRTLEKYGRSSKTMEVWKQGMSAGIFTPELHGREHISIQPWMEELRNGNEQLLHAFKEGFVALDKIKGLHHYAKGFRPEFYFIKDSQKAFLHDAIKSAASMFEHLFKYTPNSFVPSNSVFHPEFEETVFKSGIKFLGIAHKNPCPGSNGELTHTNYSFKQKIKEGQLNYYIRNCAFEPTDSSYAGIGLTLQQMESAFRWKKPAIISAHRVNFTGGIYKENRENGLIELEKLLNAIVKKWPDVEFMSTAQMLSNLKN